MRGRGKSAAMCVGVVAAAARGHAIADTIRAGLDREGGASEFLTGSQALIIEVLTEARLLRDSMRPGRWDVLVVDPARVFQDEALIPVLLDGANLKAGLGPRIVLYADVAAAAVQGTHDIVMRGIACSLVVRGVDDAHLAREVVPTRVLGPATRILLQDVGDRLAAVPPRLRAAWGAAILGASSGNVKGIASRACASRRTVERWHRAAALPTPGELLRRIHASRQSDAQGRYGTPSEARPSGSHAIARAPERDDRTLRR